MARGERGTIPEAVRKAALGNADVELSGEVDKPMLDSLLEQTAKLGEREGDVVLALTSYGGDADLARRFVLECRSLQERRDGHAYFLGKSLVYSAGITVMAAFPRDRRFLTRDTMLQIHGRVLSRTVELDGPIRGSLGLVRSLEAELRAGVALEEEALRMLIEGSDVTLEQAIDRSRASWFLGAEEAERLGLVAGLV